MDKWSTSVVAECEAAFVKMEQLMEEIRKGPKGKYTKAKTAGELSDYMDELASDIAFAGTCLRDLSEEEEND